MLINIDFNSDEAFYMQLRNQIIMGIAMSEIRDGENLPSVRELADTVGINMHTVNKAYAMLRDEGFIRLDPRHGAVINVSRDKKITPVLERELRMVTARAVLKGITREEIHDLVDRFCDEWS